jgi:hypothetical protein
LQSLKVTELMFFKNLTQSKKAELEQQIIFRPPLITNPRQRGGGGSEKVSNADFHKFKNPIDELL